MTDENRFDTPTDDGLTVRLARDATSGEIFVERVEFVAGDVVHRMQFRRPLPWAEALHARFIAQIERFLSPDDGSWVVADKEAILELPRLVLQGVRVYAQKTVHGMQSITVRFIHALGALQAMLLPRHRTETELLAHLEGMAARTLDSLIRPVLALIEVSGDENLVAAGYRQISDRLAQLAKDHTEIGIFAALLERFVANSPDPDEALRFLRASALINAEAAPSVGIGT